MSAPLADRLRPQTLDEVVGQHHLLGNDAVLRRVIESGHIPNLIFFGPSGVGKTTVARIIAGNTGKLLCRLNGTTAGTADIREVVAKRDTIDGRNGVILYLDEIQYLNKKQQQSLLEFIEDGSVTLIASTTENPYFYVYNAILSRSTIFEFKPVDAEDIEKAIQRGFDFLSEESGEKSEIENGVVAHLARTSGGDVRKALNGAEFCWFSGVMKNGIRIITLEQAEQVGQRSNMRYDRDGDEHYDILSAFHKSVRGSDENAAIHYLARLLTAGDLISVSRRLLAIASEDVGLAYPMAVPIVKACVDSALQLGLPEAQLPLAEATILLATSPKSNSAAVAIGAAMSDVANMEIGDIPSNIRDGHYAGAKKLGRSIGYKYPHDYPNNFVAQQYLPDNIKDKIYYNHGNNKIEQAAKAYKEKIVKEDKS